MVKCGKQFMVLLAAVALSSLPALSAETWYIERGSDWKLLSPASRKAFSKAEKLHRKGKLVDAVRTYDKFLAGCDPNSGL
jgi:hypothetical protein